MLEKYVNTDIWKKWWDRQSMNGFLTSNASRSMAFVAVSWKLPRKENQKWITEEFAVLLINIME